MLQHSDLISATCHHLSNFTRLTLDTGLYPLVPSRTLTLPPLCTSVSGVLRAEILVLSSQAEWLQTGRAGPICWSSLLCRTLLLFLLFDINNLPAFWFSSALLNACFIRDDKNGQYEHTGGWVDTKSWSPVQFNPFVEHMMLIVCLYGDVWGRSLLLYRTALLCVLLPRQPYSKSYYKVAQLKNLQAGKVTQV